jgi:hypothetical protein
VTTTSGAIPTYYNGLQFRSRIEATWAAFFDQVKWPWRYEPIDLNGYIPDFILAFPYGPLLVEVKSDLYMADLEHHAAKIDASGWQHESIILGGHHYMETARGVHGGFGWMNQVDGGWGQGVIFECALCAQVSIRHEIQSFACRVNGCHDGDGHIHCLPPGQPDGWWAHARNQTQWQPVQRLTRLPRLPRIHPIRVEELP